MSKTIQELAGVHLGKTADGQTMQRYEAPDRHDSSLLVPIPREFNRKQEGINTELFTGYDVWNAYEFSYLKMSGQPVTGILKIMYPADSDNIVESKSLKLYLNSFDFERFKNKSDVASIIADDLYSIGLQGVRVFLHTDLENIVYETIFNTTFVNIDNLDIPVKSFDSEDISLIKNITTHKTLQEFTLHTANLRSNCEITNQKDTGNCYIYIKGYNIPSLEEVGQYIFSLRNSQHFHENVTEIMYDKLYKLLEPKEMFVANIYNRRGGIDIHPVRSTRGALKLINSYDNASKLFWRPIQV